MGYGNGIMFSPLAVLRLLGPCVGGVLWSVSWTRTVDGKRTVRNVE